MQKTIVDSAMAINEATRQNPEFHCPPEVLDQIVLITVNYYSFDRKIHTGQIAIHKDLAEDVQGAFKLLLDDKFPIQSVIPISEDRFMWQDDISTVENNTSTFNYRCVRDTDIMSNHATGRAIDINPKHNPYFPGEKVYPPHASYDPHVSGTILPDSKLVAYFEGLGWRWGGNWDEDSDYQHFEKV